jgi:hypothetical protein
MLCVMCQVLLSILPRRRLCSIAASSAVRLVTLKRPRCGHRHRLRLRYIATAAKIPPTTSHVRDARMILPWSRTTRTTAKSRNTDAATAKTTDVGTVPPPFSPLSSVELRFASGYPFTNGSQGDGLLPDRQIRLERYVAAKANCEFLVGELAQVLRYGFVEQAQQ